MITEENLTLVVDEELLRRWNIWRAKKQGHIKGG